MKKKLLLLNVIMILTLSLTACSNDNSQTYITDSQFKFNTIMTITLYGYTDKAIFEDIWSELDRMEQLYSANLETSDVSKFNQNPSLEPIVVSPDIVTMVSQGAQYSNATSGKFDLTIEPVVKLWGISTESPRVPAQSEIDHALQYVDYQKIIANPANSTLQKLDPNSHLDLGAIAKGYAADQLVQFLNEKGITRAVLNLGGNIYVMGSKSSSTPWSVGIQDPFKATGELMGILKTSNKSVVTSGSYERHFEKDGKTYHHILNTETGYPVENELIGVTIVSDRSVEGDILSTAAFSLGLKEGMQFIDSRDHIAAIFITKDKQVYFSGNLSLLSDFELKNTEFTIKE
jgi:thiamine biosynthesis lipoprotein